MRVTKFGAMLALSVAASLSMAGELTIGSNAPALKVHKWAKGKPVKGFEKGKVYVVEFWATWCGPCKTSIPHLTELAKEYKDKVNFIGVSVWENKPGDTSTDYLGKVDAFVKEMGSKMDYNVAADDPKGWMAENWMKAAEQNGIPAAFVVDQNGKIAWIGHPMADLGGVLKQVVAGTYDPSAAKKKLDEEAKAAADAQKEMAAFQAEFNPVMELLEGGKNKEAAEKLDSLIKKYAQFRGPLINMKFDAMLKYDEKGAYAYAREMGSTELKNDSMALNQIAWTIVEAKDPIKTPDFDVAIELAQRGVELTKEKDPMVMDTLAFAHWKKGNKAKAVELQTKAVALLKDRKDVDAETVKEITDRLEMFKKG